MPTKRTTKKKESEDEVPEKETSSVTADNPKEKEIPESAQREKLEDLRSKRRHSVVLQY